VSNKNVLPSLKILKNAATFYMKKSDFLEEKTGVLGKNQSF
jgi:hypothetical protein